MPAWEARNRRRLLLTESPGGGPLRRPCQKLRGFNLVSANHRCLRGEEPDNGRALTGEETCERVCCGQPGCAEFWLRLQLSLSRYGWSKPPPRRRNLKRHRRRPA